MDYAVQVGDLSERVKREVAVIGSPGKLDEKTWDAIDAISPVAGHLVFSTLYDVTADIVYTEVDLPVEIPCGHVVYAQVGYWNDDPYAAHSLTCTVEFLDPDGSSRGFNSETTTVPADTYGLLKTLEIPLDKAGAWGIHAVESG